MKGLIQRHCVSAQSHNVHSMQMSQRKNGFVERKSNGMGRLISRSDAAKRHVAVRMGIKFIESFETQLELEPTAKEDLDKLLGNATFCKQVVINASNGCCTSHLHYVSIVDAPSAYLKSLLPCGVVV